MNERARKKERGREKKRIQRMALFVNRPDRHLLPLSSTPLIIYFPFFCYPATADVSGGNGVVDFTRRAFFNLPVGMSFSYRVITTPVRITAQNR